MSYQVFKEQLPYLRGPFSYEFIAARTEHKWRVHDSKDDPAAWADTEAEAIEVCDRLNTVHAA